MREIFETVYQTYARSLTNIDDLKVRYVNDPAAGHAEIENRLIVVGPPAPGLCTDDFEVYILNKSLVAHECAHMMYSSQETLRKARTPAEKLLTNLLEDARVERILGNRYPGIAALFALAWGIYYRKAQDVLPKMSLFEKKVYALLWLGAYGKIPPALLRDRGVAQFVRENADAVERALRAKNSDEVLEIAREILAKMQLLPVVNEKVDNLGSTWNPDEKPEADAELLEKDTRRYKPAFPQEQDQEQDQEQNNAAGSTMPDATANEKGKETKTTTASNDDTDAETQDVNKATDKDADAIGENAGTSDQENVRSNAGQQTIASTGTAEGTAGSTKPAGNRENSVCCTQNAVKDRDAEEVTKQNPADNAGTTNTDRNPAGEPAGASSPRENSKEFTNNSSTLPPEKEPEEEPETDKSGSNPAEDEPDDKTTYQPDGGRGVNGIPDPSLNPELDEETIDSVLKQLKAEYNTIRRRIQMTRQHKPDYMEIDNQIIRWYATEFLKEYLIHKDVPLQLFFPRKDADENVVTKYHTVIQSAIKKEVNQLTQILRKTLRTRSRNEYGRRYGRLDRSVLWKIKTNELNVFYQKNNPAVKEAVFYLLIDCSGSMCGSEIKRAREAAALFSEALARVGIPFAVTGYTSRDAFVFNRVVRFGYPEDIPNIAEMEAIGFSRHGLAIHIAAKELSMRREQRKILIIITDGVPEDGWGYHKKAGYEDTIKAVRAAEKAGIKVINLFVGDPSSAEEISKIFPRNVNLSETITKQEMFKRTLLRTIGTLLVKALS